MKIKEYIKYIPYKWGVEIANFENRKEKFQLCMPTEIEPKYLNSECKIIYKDYKNNRVIFGIKKGR
jgi:hypothetical protein